MLRREGDEDRCGEEAHSDVDGMHLCDRTDIFAVGLVMWEMLAGDVCSNT